jgi:hypothetical protein
MPIKKLPMMRDLKTAAMFYITLWKAKRHRASVWYEVEAKLRNAKTEDDREYVWHESEWEVQVADQTVQAIQGQYYSSKARRKGIPIPRKSEDWETEFASPEDRVLTVEAIARLRSLIRQDHKELREMWLPYAAVVISVIALLISVLNTHKPSTQQIVVPIQPIIMPTPTPAAHTSPEPIPQKQP